MTTRSRYWLFQIPGWILAIMALFLAHRWFDLPVTAAAAIFVLWIAKDAALYPFLHSAYETGVPSAADKMVGATGVAKEALDPEGFVQIGGELWKAKTRDPLATVRPGDRIRVEQVRGMKLVVSADPRPKNRDPRPKNQGARSSVSS